MIVINKKISDEPYLEFYTLYEKALENSQISVDAISIASWNSTKNEVDSRYVNLKHINEDEWTFYTNYNSPKMKQFLLHNQISALFYWNAIDTQIRMKARVFKTSSEISDTHFINRSKEKNALAISSNQSQVIGSYKEIILNYKKIINSDIDLTKRPKYWGGVSFIPYYFEFWEGHDSRINKRKIFNNTESGWDCKIVQP